MNFSEDQRALDPAPQSYGDPHSPFTRPHSYSFQNISHNKETDRHLEVNIELRVRSS